MASPTEVQLDAAIYRLRSVVLAKAIRRRRWALPPRFPTLVRELRDGEVWQRAAEFNMTRLTLQKWLPAAVVRIQRFLFWR